MRARDQRPNHSLTGSNIWVALEAKGVRWSVHVERRYHRDRVECITVVLLRQKAVLTDSTILIVLIRLTPSRSQSNCLGNSILPCPDPSAPFFPKVQIPESALCGPRQPSLASPQLNPGVSLAHPFAGNASLLSIVFPMNVRKAAHRWASLAASLNDCFPPSFSMPFTSELRR